MSSPPAELVTQAYRARSQQLSLAVVGEVAKAWRLLDPVNVDKTWPAVSKIVTQLVARGYSASQALAVTYLQTHAAVSGVDLTALLGPTIDLGRVQTSLDVTGPYAVKVAARAGQPPAQAAATALVRISGAASRLSLLGGRSTVQRTVMGRKEITGWSRITSGRACDFCSMLAGRGFVYKETTVDFPSHDHCSCSSEPGYR